MSYTKTVWVNNGAPDINAENLNHMEQGIYDAHEQISEVEQSGGLTSAIKSALLQIAQKVAYIDEHGQDYYDDLYDALYPAIVVTNITLNQNSLSFNSLNTTQQLTATTTPRGGAVTWTSSNSSVATVSQTGLVTSVAYGNATVTAASGGISASCSVVVEQATVTSISASYTQSGTVYDTDSLDSLKNDLVVTATWNDGTTSTVAGNDYTLSGTLTAGQSTITVSYGGKTTTFNVNVTANTLNSITATFNQGSSVIYDTDSLDTLKQYLTVTALYEDGSSQTVSSNDYVLNGTLAEGTSVITVNYGGKTATFTATVEHGIDYMLDAFDGVTWEVGKDYNQTTGAYVDATNQVATDKFTVQDCLYNLTGSGATYPGVYVWDENGNYQGIYESNSFSDYQVLSLSSKYTYAFHVYDANGTFVPSNAHYMPINNLANQTNPISIRLSDHLEEFTWQSGYGQIDITNILAEYGITPSNLGTKINRTSEITFISPSNVATTGLKNSNGIIFYTIAPYQGAVYLIPRTKTATNLTNLKAFISENDPVFIINGEV